MLKLLESLIFASKGLMDIRHKKIEGDSVNKIILFSAVALMLTFQYEAKGDTTAASSASATIAPAISGTKNILSPTGGDLIFGIIMPSTSSGTVTITPQNDTRNYSGGVQLVSSLAGSASFTVSGASNASYTVTLPGNGITISNGSSSMVVNSFTAFPPSGTGTIGSDGLATFNVGGKLEVNANQPAGNYRGTFNVTIAYQ